MAKNVEVLSVDDESERVHVRFEDTATNFVFEMTAQVPKEFVTEDEVLDYLATLWPYEAETQRGKSQAARHVEAKKVVNVVKNITGRVQAGDPSLPVPPVVPPVVS